MNVTKILIAFFAIILVVLLVPIMLRIMITRVEDIAHIQLARISVVNNSICVSGHLKEDNTSIWSYKDFSYSIEGDSLYITIISYPEFGKRIFSNLDFDVKIEGDFSSINSVSFKDDEKTLIIWSR